MKANRSFRENNMGVMGFFLVFIVLGFMLVILFAVAVPFLINFSTSSYAFGDQIIGDSTAFLDDIQNETIKGQLQSSLSGAQGATQDNIDILTFFYQYGWIIIIVVTSFSIYMVARKVVETQSFQAV